jgi:hypothetical protein
MPITVRGGLEHGHAACSGVLLSVLENATKANGVEGRRLERVPETTPASTQEWLCVPWSHQRGEIVEHFKVCNSCERPW